MQYNDYYIYCYYDTRTKPHTPIYVGRGRGKRYLQHYKKTHNPILAAKLKRILEETGTHAIVKKLKENLNNETANLEEIYYISLFGRLDLETGTLCNLTDGGKATDGWNPSSKTRELWSSQRKNKKQTKAQYEANCSRILTEEQKQAKVEQLKPIWEQLKGRTVPKEQIEKTTQTKMEKRPNLLDKVFGCLTVIEDISTTHRQKVKCSCSCGNREYIILVCELNRKKNLNCNLCNSYKKLLAKNELENFI